MCYVICHKVNKATFKRLFTGVDPGFQVRGGGAHLKKLNRAEGGAKIVGVFRVKNHDFTQKKSYFFQFKGGRAHRVRLPTPPPMDPPLIYRTLSLFCVVVYMHLYVQ
jgi:hypothetical protein